MRHLSPDALLDLAEGARPESSAPHLVACDECCQQVAELRRALASASASDVPEPSPLYWDHLSARVRDAVAAEQTAASAGWTMRRVAWPLAALASAAVVALAVGVVRNGPGGGQHPGALVGASGEARVAGPAAAVPLADDPSFSLLAGLAGDLDWDSAAQAGIAIGSGSVDRALAELTAGERAEMQRLLREEMTGSGV